MFDHGEHAREQDIAGKVDSLLARISELEARFEVRGDLDRHLIEEGVAKAVQSVGVVIDYLTERGLIDHAGLRKHIEANFRPADVQGAADRHGTAIDIYGWLIWAEASRYLRTPARLIDKLSILPEQGQEAAAQA